MADVTYFCRCDGCRTSLFRGNNWYHKPGTNCDVCTKCYWKLSDQDRKAYVNIQDKEDLEAQQDEYVLDSQPHFGRCDVCRKGVYVGDDWYHKTGKLEDRCARHWRELPEQEKCSYVNVRSSQALGEQKKHYVLPEESMAVSERDLVMVVMDVEGTLMPEAWLELQKKTGIEGLKRTTAHEPDYDKLMRYRYDLLRQHNVKMKDVVDVVKGMKPLPGALEFLAWLKPLVPRILLLTDTFEEYAMPMFEQLGYPCVFLNSLEEDKDGFMVNHILRLKDQKRKAVESFQRLNFRVIAVGDSFNDISMLTAAERGILIYPSDKVRATHPEFPVAKDHNDLRSKIGRILSANTRILPRELAPAPLVSATADTRRMWLFVCNIAGFLAPEPWVVVKEKTGIEELRITTQQEPNYARLMSRRAEILRKHNVRLHQVHEVMEGLDVNPGALEFLEWLKPLVPRTFMITDGFEEYALPIFDKLGHPMVICNFLDADRDGFMNRLITRLHGQKIKTVEELQRLNFRVIAVGTSLNDTDMLRGAEHGILWSPSDQVRQEHAGVPVVRNFDELKSKILDVLQPESEPSSKKARTE